MAIKITSELASNPAGGSLPLDVTMTFRASASPAITVDVIYRLVELAGETLDIAFEAGGKPFKVLRRENVVLSALPQDIEEPMRLIRGGQGAAAKLVTVWASLVERDAQDDSPHFDRTAATIRIQ